MASKLQQTYGQRAASHRLPVARALLEVMERKQTNLCVSADLTTKADLLKVVRLVAPYVCLVKVRLHS